MGRIIVTEFVSLDGVIDTPGGKGDFKYAGWTSDISRGEEGDKFKFDETFNSEAQLFGRVTYVDFAAAWPSMKGEFADKFNALPKYVVSSTLKKGDWGNTTVLNGNMVEQITNLKKIVDGNIVVHGSAKLVQGLLENNLLDELRLMIFPVILGSGKRLFGDTTDKKRLQLIDSKKVGDGVAILTYERATGDLKT
jgi:dihydrofolate reductase